MCFLLFLVPLLYSESTVQLSADLAERSPLAKPQIVLESPKNYAKELKGFDPKTKKPIYYDPKPRVVVIDEKSGKYGLRWIGRNGKELQVIYQRPDAIDAVVVASASKRELGSYVYTYEIKVSPSSGQNLAGFSLQHFASDATPIRMNNVYIGPISRNDKEFNEGNWIGFRLLDRFKPVVGPGSSVQFRLRSGSPPGLVECRVDGGVRGMKGVGEEMPQELGDVLPGYEAWPRGFTIAPIQRLKGLSHAERVEYLLSLFPSVEKLGWVASNSAKWYRQNLKGANAEKVSKHASEDFNSGRITSEFYTMVINLL